MPRGCGLYTIDTTILRNTSKSTKKKPAPMPKAGTGLWFLGEGHSFPKWEDTPSLHPGLNQECPPLAGMSLESTCTLQ